MNKEMEYDFPCSICGGNVGHIIDCPRGSAFTTNGLLSKIPTLEELLQAGAYFGHKKERSSPAAKPVVFAVRSGINIINLNKTQEGLELALKFLEQ